MDGERPSDAIAEAGMRALCTALRRENPGYEFTWSLVDEPLDDVLLTAVRSDVRSELEAAAA